MKLTDSYLCLDCNEVFQPDRSLMVNWKNPVCPGCGNRFNMSLGKILNRKVIEYQLPHIVDERGFFLQE